MIRCHDDSLAAHVEMLNERGKRTPLQALADTCRNKIFDEKFGTTGRLWIMTDTAADDLLSRHVRSTHVPLDLKLVPENLATLQQEEEDTSEEVDMSEDDDRSEEVKNFAILLAGESGSGKTYQSLWALPPLPDKGSAQHKVYAGVYLLASDLTWDDKKDYGEDRKGKDARNVAAAKALTAAVKGILEEKSTTLHELLQRTDILVIVVDEAGFFPQLVRALCSSCARITGRFFQKANIAPGTKKEVRLIVVGTGVDQSSCAPGSMPDTYHIVRMPECDQLFEAAWPDKKARSSVQAAALVDRSALNMQKNFRLAAIIVQKINAFSGMAISYTIRQAQELLLPSILQQSALRFKRLNGLKKLYPPTHSESFPLTQELWCLRNQEACSLSIHRRGGTTCRLPRWSCFGSASACGLQCPHRMGSSTPSRTTLHLP